MLQDIKPYKLQNEFKDLHLLPPDHNSLLLIRKGGELLFREEGGKVCLPFVTESAIDAESLTYLISVDNVRFYTLLGGAESTIESLLNTGYSFHSSRDLRYKGPAWLRYGALTAWQLAGWYEDNSFCGKCGSPMKHSDKERALICGKCGKTIYPNLCPVVIVGVIHDEKILLTKYAARGAYANYALVAGFAEIGETIEETVMREVMEETGLKVKNLRYYKSQPWAYSESLLFGFFCEADDPSAVKADGEELSSAEWTDRSDIPDYGDEISLTYEMMSQFRNNAEITQYR